MCCCMHCWMLSNANIRKLKSIYLQRYRSVIEPLLVSHGDLLHAVHRHRYAIGGHGHHVECRRAPAQVSYSAYSWSHLSPRLNERFRWPSFGGSCWREYNNGSVSAFIDDNHRLTAWFFCMRWTCSKSNTIYEMCRFPHAACCMHDIGSLWLRSALSTVDISTYYATYAPRKLCSGPH